MTHSGGKPHTNVGDRGQRYEVSYWDISDRVRKVFGWATTLEGAAQFCGAIDLHPNMDKPQVFDREAQRKV